MKMATNPNFRINLMIFIDFMGVQEGNNYGENLIFAEKLFNSQTIKTNNK